MLSLDLLGLGEPIGDSDLGDDYQVQEKIGKGAYSTVWRALHKPTGSLVAVKKEVNIFDDLVNCKRVLREIKLLRMLKHANIVKLLDLRANDADPRFVSICLVLDLGEVSLKKLLKSARYLQPAQVQTLMYQILVSLKYMHSAGVIHRDLKPGNVLLYPDCTLKLCDFGLARCISSDECSPLSDPAPVDELDPELELDTPEEGQVGRVCVFFPGASYEVGERPLMSKASSCSTTSEVVVSDKPLILVSPPQPCSPGAPAVKSRVSTKHLLRKPNPGRKKFRKMLTTHVVTRWYRAPEVILMESDYGPAIDVWAAGCIFGELLVMLKGNASTSMDRRPLFPGTSCYPLSPGRAEARDESTDQLSLILEVLGTPTEEDYSFVTEPKKVAELRALPKIKRLNFSSRYPAAAPEAIDLLNKMLVFSPLKRLTVEQCLEHPYFTGVRNKATEAVAQGMLSFDFEDDTDLDEEKLRGLLREELDFYHKLRTEGKGLAT